MPVRVQPSVWARDELKAVVLAMKGMDRTVRAEINRVTRQTMGPVWRELVESRATTTQQNHVLARGARIATGSPPRAVAGSSTRPLRGGLWPAEHALVFEHGSKRRGEYATYERVSPRGNRHTVRRRTRAQLPPHKRGGYVVYPAFKEWAPRAVSLWVQFVVRKTYEAFEGRRR